ncbi:MAG: hypothetical protein JXO51_11700 [Candidatus Aminicenantes bacterium]|nr:hypothetical protein [Candidatus Aminicenantes bacterium]
MPPARPGQLNAGTMRRFFLWVLVALALFFLVFFGLNLFDTRTAGKDGSSSGYESPPAADLGPSNGFFFVWGFAEPPGTDLRSDSYRFRVRELFASPPRGSHTRSRFGLWWARLNEGYRQHWQGTAFYFPQLPGEDAAQYFAARRERIVELRKRFAEPLRRYRLLLQAEKMEDFTPPGWECPGRSVLLAVQAAKFFAATRVLAALDGEWGGAVGDLLDAAAAGFGLIAQGRTPAVNGLGRDMVELSLRALASLLNRAECPPTMADLVLERMPDRPAHDFGTSSVRAFALAGFSAVLERIKREGIVDPFLLKNHFRRPAALFALERFMAISGPRLFAAFHGLAAFFTQKNESVAMMRTFWDGVGALEETPPWRWKATPLRGRSAGAASGPFWWLRNPVGKMLVSSAVPYNWPILQHYVYRTHELKARCDLLRLLAQARRAAAPGMELDGARLRRMLAAGGIDPFSGSPYRFGRGQKALYALGPDGIDDGGREQAEIWRRSDIAVPIRFVIPSP